MVGVTGHGHDEHRNARGRRAHRRPVAAMTDEQAGRPQQLAVVAEDTHLDTRRARERCRIDGRPGRDDSRHAEVGERPVSRCVPTA